MFEIIKNMFRRKLRTILTIFGIGIGIFALVVMGAIAEKLNLLVDGGTKYYKDKVVVSTKGTVFTITPMQITKKADLEKVDGVAAVFGETYSLLDANLSAVNFGPPASITGEESGASNYEGFKLYISKGRGLKEDDRAKAVIGSDLVKKLNTDIGKTITLHDKKFEVVGIYEKTFTTPDTSVQIPFKDGQELMYADQPEIIKNNVSADKIIYGLVVYPKPGVSPDDLAKKIEKEVPDVSAIGPKAFSDQIASSVKIFTSIIYGIAIISLLVGSLSIINTMIMSISERTKEIGIKKAVGAKNKDIMLEYLTEAGIMGFLGGLIGIGLGSALVYVVNSIMEQSGDKIFLISNRLLAGSLLFAVILGIVAGIYPAYYAVKITIVKSLREE